MPLHGWSANTAVEGEHNAMNYDDTRIQLPLGALMSTALRCNFRILCLIQTANDATSANNHLFQTAYQFRDYEVEMSGLYVVQKTSDNDIFCVTKAGSEGMLVDIGKEGDEVCNESMREVLNEDGVLHEVDVHENALSESKCDVAIDGEKKKEDVALTMLVDVRKESNQVIDVHEKALSELSLML